MHLFLIVGLTISIFLLLLLSLRSGKTRADYILIIWMALLTIQLLTFYFLFNGILYQYPGILIALSPIPLLYGILIYFYTLEVTGRFHLSNQEIALHFIPFILLYLLAIPFYQLPAEEQFTIVNGDFSGFQWYMIIKVAFFMISGLSYSAVSIFEVYKYRKRIKNYLSNTDHVQLRWLEMLSAGMGIIWFLLFLDDTILSILATIFIITIALFSINQLPILYSNHREIADTPKEPADEAATQNKYARSGLDQELMEQIIEKLEDFMRTKKAYKDPELTLNELSDKTGIPSHQLSQAINTHLGKTFYHYINQLRLEEFLQIARQPESRQYTYLSLAYDAGFNSKTTFNKYFKITTGQTPTQYFNAQA